MRCTGRSFLSREYLQDFWLLMKLYGSACKFLKVCRKSFAIQKFCESLHPHPPWVQVAMGIAQSTSCWLKGASYIFIMLTRPLSPRTPSFSPHQSRSTCRASLHSDARQKRGCDLQEMKTSHMPRRAAILGGLSLTLLSQGEQLDI